MAMIFGKQFVGTERIIPLLMLSVYFAAINQSLRVIYDGVGKRWLNLSMWVLWGVVFLSATVYYVPKTGAVGFALAHLAGEIVLLVVQAVYVDLFLVKSVLRRHLALFAFCVALLAAAYATKFSMSQWMAYVSGLFILITSCIPILVSLKDRSADP